MNHPVKKVCVFCRVSTVKQEYERQIDDLTNYSKQKGYEVSTVIASKISGGKTDAERPDLIELLEKAKAKLFSKVLVTEISRLGRDAKSIRNTIDSLHKLGVSVVFQNLGGVESLDDNGQESFLINIIIAIQSEWAQEERRIIRDRIKSSLARVRLTKKLGRPVGTGEDNEILLSKYPKLTKDIANGLSLAKCVKLHDLSKNTVIKVKRAMAA